MHVLARLYKKLQEFVEETPEEQKGDANVLMSAITGLPILVDFEKGIEYVPLSDDQSDYSDVLGAGEDLADTMRWLQS